MLYNKEANKAARHTKRISLTSFAINNASFRVCSWNVPRGSWYCSLLCILPGVELPVDLPSLHLVWLYHCLYIPSLGRVSDVRTVSVSLSILAAIGAVMFVGLQCRVLAIVIHNLCSRQMHGDVCVGLWYPCMCLGSMLPMYHNLSGRLMHGGLSIIT